MSCEEWNMQSDALKALRVKGLVKGQYPEAQAMRGRILEQKLKVKAEEEDKSRAAAVADDDVRDALDTGREAEGEDKPSAVELTGDDVRDALDAGREHMQVIALQCVGYEASVQKRLRDFALRPEGRFGGNNVQIHEPTRETQETGCIERVGRRAV